MIFKLPIELFIELLGYLLTQDLMELDSACTNVILRPMLLDIFKLKHVATDNYCNQTNQTIKWIVTKRLGPMYYKFHVDTYARVRVDQIRTFNLPDLINLNGISHIEKMTNLKELVLRESTCFGVMLWDPNQALIEYERLSINENISYVEITVWHTLLVHVFRLVTNKFPKCKHMALRTTHGDSFTWFDLFGFLSDNTQVETCIISRITFPPSCLFEMNHMVGELTCSPLCFSNEPDLNMASTLHTYCILMSITTIHLIHTNHANVYPDALAILRDFAGLLHLNNFACTGGIESDDLVRVTIKVHAY